MSKLRKVDREVMVHEQSELETEKKESNKMRRQQFRNILQNPVITMNETTVACKD